jgi:hypothetical protein
MKDYRYFSPSFTRKQYIDKVKSWSEETCHNLIRLILRPDHRSSNHWINEITPRIYRTITTPISSRNKPIEYIFDDIAIIKDKFEWNPGWIEGWMDKVREEKYGKFEQVTVDQVISKLNTLLISLKNCKESDTYPEVKELLIIWSKLKV